MWALIGCRMQRGKNENEEEKRELVYKEDGQVSDAVQTGAWAEGVFIKILAGAY